MIILLLSLKGTGLYNTAMTESVPGAEPAGQDPTLGPLQNMLETLTGQHAVPDAAEAIGAAATGAASEGVQAAPSGPVEILHERPKPVHWDELVEFASTLPVYEYVGDDFAYYNSASVDALREKLVELTDDEALDQCRYYSIGEMLRGLAQGLQDPERRAAVVAAAGNELFTSWKLEGTPTSTSFMPEDINGIAASRAFGPMVEAYTADLPPHIKMLYDVLDWHVAERQESARTGEPAALFAHLSKKGLNGEHYEAGEGVERVGQVTAAAASRVLRRVLQMRAGYLKDNIPGFPATPTAQEVIDNTDMDDINLIPVAQRAAAVRLDELRDLEAELLELDEQGRAVFNGKKLPRVKDLAPAAIDQLSRAVIHTRRLRCPAIFVEGLIPGMMASLIDAVKIADGKTKEMYAHTHRNWLDPNE